MLSLGFDTSNYATSIAVYCSSTNKVVYNDKKFLPVKKGELGLRQSDAVFHHTNVLPLMMQNLNKKVNLCEIEAVGVSEKPRPLENSYMPCFLPGVSAAYSFALGKNLKLYKTTHQQGHIAAAMYACNDDSLFSKQCLVFHVSGGTTELLLCEGTHNITKIGESTDLYAGQAVDRLGVKLGFAFPAGEELTKLALNCKEDIKPKVSVNNTNCSLSGLENICDALLKNNYTNEYVAKYCLLAIGLTAYKMVIAAKKQYSNIPVIFAGGVMSSTLIQKQIKQYLQEAYFVNGLYSSDNAIGVAVLAAKEVMG